ncbi:MAG: sigma-70 family RNA polymerase sigma factor [Deltaproteobacteria bacterium]|nr:sigma-70 family RNA polymerase sigma factor [Deltaproteobacteria bacterium]MBI4796784.1 sigma-70 family RNA polymerase sigma factor [Deltaproteobacteria bacterium]
MTDPQLVALAQQGDLPAFEELVKKYQREIYGLAYRLVLDAEEAKDLAQQAFMQAFVHIRGFRQQAQFRTWLFRIAINQCYNYLKNKKKFGDPVDCEEFVLVGEDSSPEEDLVSQEEHRRLYAALTHLPAKQRAVITLKLEQGLSYEEISRVLGGTAGAARVNYCQAIKTLKKYLQNEDEHEVAVRSYPKMVARVSRR